ncbi:hypothetical protein AGOR_G00037780 [Albula goreensis]|uniref:Neurochondrin n=1 Tax=Albula goreensis TaxID=1534307 RepID=A0A8T3E0I8_9TELE|nr:hypothetical protein AGOR_G00037780 [Albula goreensis]
MAEKRNPVNSDSCGAPGSDGADSGLTPSQQDMLERCLHALTHANNDSHTLAALLLITRLCPANQLDSATLKRVFEAVGLSLPARLLVTAMQGGTSSGLPPEELVTLGTALLAALSTDPDMAAHPQLLSTIPLLLGLLADGPGWTPQMKAQGWPKTDQEGQSSSVQNENGVSLDKEDTEPQTAPDMSNLEQSKSTPGEPGEHQGSEESLNSKEGVKTGATKPRTPTTCLDKALAVDCYQILSTVCATDRGPEQLLSRGAVPALCRAIDHKQTLSQEKALPLLGHLLSSHVRPIAWSKHPTELVSLLSAISTEFCHASGQDQLDMCTQLPHFLPPPGGAPESKDLKSIVSQLWGALRPMVQAKVTSAQLGPILVLSACLLDLFGWELVGTPKFCCLLVNRACVEVRMGLEELPGTDLTPVQQHVLTACYRIMEAAMEQACSQGFVEDPSQLRTTTTGLSLQQSRQVLGVLEEAFSAVIYYLQLVDKSHHGDPFIFATFRSLCAWLAEETSCLKDEVIALLPFLINYAKEHLEGESPGKGLLNWMSEMSVNDTSQGGTWTGEDALRYLLPALCHLSAEEGPRQVLLTLDTPALLVGFLERGWGALKGRGGVCGTRDPSMETACSALLNFAVTEADRVRKDPCFVSLQCLLTDALPVLLHKPRLLVLAANFCTLGLMIGRLKPAPKGRALTAGPGPAQVSTAWVEWWEEVAELWRLGLQALAGCVQVQPWLAAVAREGGWLGDTLALLSSCSALPDPHTKGALEEALVAVARQCPLCREEISTFMVESKGVLHSMTQLHGALTHCPTT